MLHRVFWGFVRRACYIIALVVVVSAIIINIGRILAPFAEEGKPVIEHMTAKLFHQSVHIQKFTIGWQGLHPVMVLQGVTVENSAGTPLLNVNRLSFGINVWQSLLHRQLLPDFINLDGAHFTVQQRSDGSWEALGVKPNSKTDSVSLGSLKQLLYWLATKSKVSVKHVSAELHYFQGQRFTLKDLQLEVRNNYLHHSIVMVGKVGQTGDLQPFKFIMLPTNTTGGIHAFAAQFYLETPLLKFDSFTDQLMLSRYVKPMELQSRSVKARVWGTFKFGQLINLKGMLFGKGIKISNQHSGQDLLINHITSRFFWQMKNKQWRLLLDHIQLVSGGEDPWETHQLVLYGDNKVDQTYSLHLDQINSAHIKTVFKLLGFWNKSWDVWDQKMEPQATFKHLDLIYQPTKSDKPKISFQANFFGLGLKPYQHFPGMKQINGSVLLADNKAMLTINSPHASINYPFLFRQPFSDINLKTTILLNQLNQPNSWIIKIPTLAINTNNLQYSGKVGVLLAKNKAPKLALSGDFKAKNVGKLSRYVPIHGFTPRLTHWLTSAFHGGSVDSGHFDFEKSSNKKSDFHLALQVKGLDLAYSPNWSTIKNISGHLTIDNKRMEIKSQQGDINGNAIQNVSVMIPDMANPSILIDGIANGSMKDGFHFLQKSPLSIGKYVGQWQSKGPIKLHLKIAMDLKPDKPNPDVDGEIQFLNDQFQWMKAAPKITRLNGKLYFHNHNLSAQKLTGFIDHQPVSASLSTVYDNAKKPVLLFQLAGQFNVNQISHYAKGVAVYRGLLKMIDTGKALTSELSLFSDLQGVSLDLPYPYGKKHNEIHPLSIHMRLDDQENLSLNLSYQHLLSLSANYQLNNDVFVFHQGELRLGEGDANANVKQGLLVDGYLPTFDWKTWQSYITPFLHSTNDNHFSFVKAVNLEVKKVNILNNHFGNTFLNYVPKKSAQFIQVQNKMINGSLTIPDDSNQKWVAQFNKINLVLEGKTSFDHTDLDPRKIPAIDFSCDNFTFGHHHLGKVHLNVSHTNAGLTIENVSANNAVYSFKAKGRWECHQKQCLTSFDGSMNDKDLGAFLRDFNLTDALTQGFGNLNFSLQWSGAPYHVDWNSVAGSLAFNYVSGRIVKLSSQANSKLGLGRLLNLLSLQSIPDNIFSGFTHLGAKGFEFDSLKGSMSINNGVGYTKNVELHGPVAWVKLNGNIDFSHKQYYLKMRVVPNVTSSLPLIIGLTGGPIAGAVSWVVNEILAPKIGEVAASNYLIQGSIKNPRFTKINHNNNRKH